MGEAIVEFFVEAALQVVGWIVSLPPVLGAIIGALVGVLAALTIPGASGTVCLATGTAAGTVFGTVWWWRRSNE